MLVEQVQLAAEPSESVGIVHPTKQRTEVIAPRDLRCGGALSDMQQPDAFFQNDGWEKSIEDRYFGCNGIVGKSRLSASFQRQPPKLEFMRI